MKCSKCGTHLEDNMKFCTKCGTPVEAQSAGKTTTQTAPGQTQQPLPEVQPAAGTPGQELAKKVPLKWVGIAAAVIVVLIIVIVSGAKKNNKPVEEPEWTYVEATPTPEATAEPTEEVPEPTEEVPATADVTVHLDDANGALADVQVALSDAFGNAVATATTGADGNAVFHDVAFGKYTVWAAKDDYNNAFIDNVTVDGENAEGGVQLGTTLSLKTTDLDVYTLVITDDSIVPDVDVSLFEGHNTTEGDPVYTMEADSNGLCTFENVPNGNYTLVCVSDLYFRYVQDIHVGDDNAVKARLVPIPKEGEAYVVLDWDDPTLDLDLCVFNSESREYINITHPRDKKGSFIHADNKGEVGTEVILLRDINSKSAQTVYVLDTSTAESDSRDSVMGKTGTHVTVYERYKDPVKYTMDYGENALVWTACYFESGEVNVMDENQYSNVVTDFIWAVDIIGSK